MQHKFVETENVARFHTALSALNQRGAEEACLMVVYGVPGLGKTTTLRRWVGQNGGVYDRAKKEWTPNWMLNELLKSLGIQTPPHSFEKKYELALKEIAGRMMNAQMADRVFSIVIDEADHISNNTRLMETLRDISDVAEVPVVLVGMAKIRDNLNKFPQISSRVAQYCQFKSATQADVVKFIHELCDVPVAADLAKFVWQVSGGYNREIKEAIAHIERFGKRNEPGKNGLTLADMAGQVIVNDRATGKPIMVREMAQ